MKKRREKCFISRELNPAWDHQPQPLGSLTNAGGGRYRNFQQWQFIVGGLLNPDAQSDLYSCNLQSSLYMCIEIDACRMCPWPDVSMARSVQRGITVAVVVCFSHCLGQMILLVDAGAPAKVGAVMPDAGLSDV